jgi:hypothetical protein
MPRQKSIVTMIRDLVRDEVQKALNRLFEGLGSVGVGPRAALARTKPAPKNGRRRRRTAGRKKAAPAAKRGRGGARKRRKPAAPGT